MMVQMFFSQIQQDPGPRLQKGRKIPVFLSLKTRNNSGVILFTYNELFMCCCELFIRHCELFLVYIFHILYTLDRSERSRLIKSIGLDEQKFECEIDYFLIHQF